MTDVPTGRSKTSRQDICPICGASAAATLRKGPWDYGLCTGCGHGFLLQPAVDPVEFYGADYFCGNLPGGYDDYARDESFHRAIANARIARLRKAGLAPPALVAEIGCAYNFGLLEWIRNGFTVAAAEISNHARAEAERRLGQRLYATSAELARACNGRCDAVALFQVLEHIEDARSTLRDCAQMLRPGGWLAIETWDRGSVIAKLLGARWQQVAPPAVVHLFSRESLSRLLVQEGFTLVQLKRFSKPIPIRFALEQAARSYPAVAAIARMASPIVPRRWGVRYLGDDLVFCIARKQSLGA